MTKWIKKLQKSLDQMGKNLKTGWACTASSHKKSCETGVHPENSKA